LDGSCGDNGGCGPGSAQYEWLRSELPQHAERCILAYWHQPRFSSGTVHGSNSAVDPFWRLLAAAGTDLVLNGHEHNYERFAPQDADALPSSSGIVEIVAGTGGASEASYPFGDPIPNSMVRLNGIGVAELDLWSDGWFERFVRPNGDVVDQASGGC
jgi:alkaline phosphatase